MKFLLSSFSANHTYLCLSFRLLISPIKIFFTSWDACHSTRVLEMTSKQMYMLPYSLVSDPRKKIVFHCFHPVSETVRAPGGVLRCVRRGKTLNSPSQCLSPPRTVRLYAVILLGGEGHCDDKIACATIRQNDSGQA